MHGYSPCFGIPITFAWGSKEPIIKLRQGGHAAGSSLERHIRAAETSGTRLHFHSNERLATAAECEKWSTNPHAILDNTDLCSHATERAKRRWRRHLSWDNITKHAADRLQLFACLCVPCACPVLWRRLGDWVYSIASSWQWQ